MVGHVYFSKDFSDSFKELLRKEYYQDETRLGYWEDVYIKNIGRLPLMRANRYEDGEIEEFDSLDELREFDSSYLDDTRSNTIRMIANRLDCSQSEMTGFSRIPSKGKNVRFSFLFNKDTYVYDSEYNSLKRL